ncbi:type II toxin-antitoxin system RelE/ParE family toxin [Chryseobacterium suipulveris]|uniref:type II toxin-antitoxin system RelE/ParE family toxin n=1 Tax=Chryseobacterium suipulveris TaxID=2929800 RepID=UPI0037BEB47D
MQNWSIKEIESFENRFDTLLERLKDHTLICPKSRLLNYRKCLIDRNNSLIYQEVNNKIFLITIVDNRSRHI